MKKVVIKNCSVTLGLMLLFSLGTVVSYAMQPTNVAKKNIESGSVNKVTEKSNSQTVNSEQPGNTPKTDAKQTISSNQSTSTEESLAKAPKSTNLKPGSLQIRFLDSFEAMKESKVGVQARKKLEQQEQAFTQEIKEMGEELQHEISEYTEMEAVLSDEEKTNRDQSIQKKRAEYEERVKQVSYQMNAAMQKATEDLGKQLESVVAEIAKNEKLDVVQDIATGRVIYVAETLKITDSIVKELDTRYDQKQAKIKKASESKTAQNNGNKVQ